jgi:hypothetical protein
MGILRKRNIIKSSKSKSSKIFETLFDDVDFEHIDYSSPKDYISQYWNRYISKYHSDNAALNGNVFELIIYTLLYREGILPFYTQAKVAFVPNVIFDAIFYTPSFPISLSLKTSLRERYKQADLEAIALMHVHRKAKSYLLTLDTGEAKSCNDKILSGDIIGIDKIIDCNSSDIDNLIIELKKIKEQISISPTINIIVGNLIQ